jgi:tRNA(Arg) A34 adenosine deaminase TadA
MKVREIDGYNVGAVVLDRRGCVLNYGFNSYIKTHPRMKHNHYYTEWQIFVHAECSALYNCKQEPYSMIICRLDKAGNPQMSKPCIGCFSEIKKSSLKRVYYTNENNELVLLDIEKSLEEY